MKKLLISFCCFIILIGITGCNMMNDVSDDENKESTDEKNNTSEESEADIKNLFLDIQELESIITMRIDILYTLDTSEQIDELVNRLEDIEYIEYIEHDTEKSNVEKATGSTANGINLVFHYKNSSMKEIDFTSTEEGEFVVYTEVTHKPYKEETRMYKTSEQNWYDLLAIMKKGEMKDLNEK